MKKDIVDDYIHFNKEKSKEGKTGKPKNSQGQVQPQSSHIKTQNVQNNQGKKNQEHLTYAGFQIFAPEHDEKIPYNLSRNF